MDSLLQACYENFGPVPRSFSEEERAYVFARFSPWVNNDRLKPLKKAREPLVERGRIVWGAVVQANALMYQPGHEDAPGLAVWSEYPALLHNPLSLRTLAHEIGALKSDSSDGELKEIGDVLRNETGRPINFPVPEKLAHNAYLTSILLARRHLPFGFLTSALLPLLILPEETPYCLILPGRFWPNALKDR